MSSMDDLATWLRAQLDEDERVAEAALARTRRWPKGDRPWESAALRAELNPGSATVLERLAALANPDRVLAEVAAKRRIIDLHEGLGDRCDTCVGGWAKDEDGADFETHAPMPCPTLLALATPYSARPGWLAEWTIAQA